MDLLSGPRADLDNLHIPASMGFRQHLRQIQDAASRHGHDENFAADAVFHRFEQQMNGVLDGEEVSGYALVGYADPPLLPDLFGKQMDDAAACAEHIAASDADKCRLRRHDVGVRDQFFSIALVMP